MAIFYGIDSSYASSLFSSLNNSNNSQIGNVGNYLSDYASIRNGSYSKLLKKYYSLDSTSDSSNKKTSLSTSKDDTKTLKAIDNTTDALKESADTLLSNGSNSVFRKVSKTDEKGNVTNEYDKDKIYGAVKQFVDDYNDVVDSVGKSNTSSIQSNAKAMYYLTQANKALLSSVGIGVDTDGKLSVNEESFKKADMSTVKSLFHGAGSYGYQVSAKASLINYNVETENKRANTYTNSGTYAYNYSQGNFYNDVF